MTTPGLPRPVAPPSGVTKYALMVDLSAVGIVSSVDVKGFASRGAGKAAVLSTGGSVDAVIG